MKCPARWEKILLSHARALRVGRAIQSEEPIYPHDRPHHEQIGTWMLFRPINRPKCVFIFIQGFLVINKQWRAGRGAQWDKGGEWILCPCQAEGHLSSYTLLRPQETSIPPLKWFVNRRRNRLHASFRNRPPWKNLPWFTVIRESEGYRRT